MGNVHCYGIQDIRKCSTASNSRKRSGKSKLREVPWKKSRVEWVEKIY